MKQLVTEFPYMVVEATLSFLYSVVYVSGAPWSCVCIAGVTVGSGLDSFL